MSIALPSSDLDRGENTGVEITPKVGVEVQIVCDIDPDEPSNMESFLAFEWTQAVVHSFCVNDVA